MACRRSTGCATGAPTPPCSCSPFDLLEINGQDLRREPLEVRERELGKLLRWTAHIGLQFNEHIAEPGDVVFRHACKRSGSSTTHGDRTQYYNANGQQTGSSTTRDGRTQYYNEKWQQTGSATSNKK